MGIRVGLSILLMVGLFAGYVVLMPSLVAIGIPGGIVTFGTVAPSLAFITERRSWSGEDPCETFDVLGFTLGAGRQGNAT